MILQLNFHYRQRENCMQKQSSDAQKKSAKLDYKRKKEDEVKQKQRDLEQKSKKIQELYSRLLESVSTGHSCSKCRWFNEVVNQGFVKSSNAHKISCGNIFSQKIMRTFYTPV